MDDWDNFYMLAGGTGGTLIGLIFVVIPLGIDHTKRATSCALASTSRPFIYFTSLLVIAMVMVPPMRTWRAPFRSG